MATALTTGEGAPSALQGLGRLSVVRQLVLLAAVAGAIALGVAVALWSQRPGMQVLFAHLDPGEAQQIVDALGAAGIEHEIDRTSGAVRVPGAKLHEARMRLASQGYPKSAGVGMGMEMLAEKRALGTSEFQEHKRYHQALQVELQRTIAKLSTVTSASVFLGLPRESAFLRRDRDPTASVMVELAAGRTLEEGQADAIVHLVASAIPNLKRTNVSVIDDRGNVHWGGDRDAHLGLSKREFDHLRQMEQRYAQSIERILVPIVGPDAVTAQVTAEFDYSRNELSRESFNPDAPALRSEQLLDERSAAQLPGGIPGALTNQPPGVGQAPEVNPEGAAPGGGLAGQAGANAAAARDRARTRSTRNFELDRTVSHTLTPSGRLRRLSVAVVVDHARSVDAGGEVVRTPRTPEEIARLTALVKDAIGFDAERGDRVTVTNEAFTEPDAIEPVPPLPLWREPWVLDAARQVGGVLLVLLIAFGVLRPVMRSLVAREVSEREVEQARLAAQVAGVAPEGAEAGEGGHGPALLASQGGQAVPGQQRIETLRQLVNEDPRRVANVVRNWVDDG